MKNKQLRIFTPLAPISGKYASIMQKTHVGILQLLKNQRFDFEKDFSKKRPYLLSWGRFLK